MADSEIDPTESTGARLREAFSKVAPEGFPTIGVREAIVDAVRARRRHKQRVALSLAACCVVIAGASVAATTIHIGKSQPSISAAPSVLGHSASGSAGAAGSPSSQKSSAGDRVAAQCAIVSSGAGSSSVCGGVFSTPPAGNATYASAAEPSESQAPTSTSAGAKHKASFSVGTGSGNEPAGGGTGVNGTQSQRDEALTANGAGEVVVPVGSPVTVNLPGFPGEIWTSPAVQSGQGQGAAGVRTTSATAGAPGYGSSATFVSGAPVNVVVVASELIVCGPVHAVCGVPTQIWSVILEFRKP